MSDNSDKTTMAEGSVSASEPEMGNKHGSPKKNKNNNDYTNTNGNGELSDSSDGDYKYVSIVDVNPSSPQYHSAIGESLHQNIEVNSPVKTNGDVSSVSVNGEAEINGRDSLVKVNGDDSHVIIGDVSPNQNGETLKIVVESKENGHAVSRVSVNGDFEHSEDSLDVCDKSDSKHYKSSTNILSTSNISNISASFVDLVQNGSQSCVESPIQNVSPLRDETACRTSTPFTKQYPREENPELNEPFIQNGSVSIVDESLNTSILSEDEVERVVREKLKRQRSGSSDYWMQEDTEDQSIVDFLGKSTDDAEARLAAKRQARAEAREIRMRELEKVQRESEDNDRVYDIYSSPDGLNRSVRAGSVTTPRSLLSSNNSYHSSRRSSEDSLEEVSSIRDVRMELKECEDKFRKAMVANAQLDNEKAALAYQVDLFKDKYEELEEQHHQLTREHKETCRQLDQTKRHRVKLQEDLDVSRAQLEELLQLIQEKGLVVVEGEEEVVEDGEDGESRIKPPKKALVSAEVADVLQQGSGSLDVRLKRFVEERNELVDELRRVKLELEEERASRGRHTNGPTDDLDDIQREANKLLGDYKFKLQKAEQDVSTLQATVARLESQVVRYKSAAETSEKLEVELKLEKRKLQRELREAQARVEELETSHSHLQRRLDKLKNAKSALLKDL